MAFYYCALPCFPHFLKGERGGNRESVRARDLAESCEADSVSCGRLLSLGHIRPRKAPVLLPPWSPSNFVTPTSSTSDSPQVLPAAVVERRWWWWRCGGSCGCQRGEEESLNGTIWHCSLHQLLSWTRKYHTPWRYQLQLPSSLTLSLNHHVKP